MGVQNVESGMNGQEATVAQMGEEENDEMILSGACPIAQQVHFVVSKLKALVKCWNGTGRKTRAMTACVSTKGRARKSTFYKPRDRILETAALRDHE